MRPLLLSLMISAFTSGIAAFRRLNRSYFQLYSSQSLMIETQLNFKSYFLQFVLCQYVKDLLHLPSTMYNVQFALAMRRGE